MLRIYDNKFIGYHESYSHEKFTGSDTEILYHKNLESSPIDWYYRDTEISYERNSKGHRCREINDINLNDYILTIGCSHTEGIGLEIEKTYPYVLSKILKCDYYNLGIGGTGSDVLIHNLSTWLNTYTKPKLLIVQWPHTNRFSKIDYDNIHEPDIIKIQSIGPWKNERENGEFLLAGDKINFFKTVEYLAKIKIDSYNLPTIHVGYKSFNSFSDEFNEKSLIELEEIDKARDGIHNGMQSNENLANKIVDKYKHELNNN